MRDGREAELAACQMHDARRTKRLGRLLDRLRARPVNRIPTACHGWAATVAASRLGDHPAIGVQELLSGHTQATRPRLRAPAVVLRGRETTVLEDGTPHPQAGMGPVKRNTRAADRLHPPVVLTPARVNSGVAGMDGWPRPEPPVAQPRQHNPMAAQERDRWLAGDHGACAVKQACPATLVVHLADRAGDLREWCVAALRREPGHRAAWSIRAQANRRLAPGATQRYGWAERQPTGALGHAPSTARARLSGRPDRSPSR
jgi:hypothetical protein